jgi:hypothetical protein
MEAQLKSHGGPNLYGVVTGHIPFVFTKTNDVFRKKHANYTYFGVLQARQSHIRSSVVHALYVTFTLNTSL